MELAFPRVLDQQRTDRIAFITVLAAEIAERPDLNVASMSASTGHHSRRQITRAGLWLWRTSRY